MTATRNVRGALTNKGLGKITITGSDKWAPLKRITAEETAAIIGISLPELDALRLQGRGPTRRSDDTYIPTEVELWADTHGRHLHQRPERARAA